MAKDYSRKERVADYLIRELSVLIQREVRDPRLSMVNITAAEVSRDMGYAKIWVTFVDIEDEQQQIDALKTLNNAAGFLRSLLAKDMQMRTVPKLRFIYDESIHRGAYLSSLIDEVVAKDRSNQDKRGDVPSTDNVDEHSDIKDQGE